MPGKAKRVNGNASNQHNGSGKRRRDGCTCYNRISQQGLLTHSRDSLLTVLGAGSFESKVPAWPGEGLTDFSSRGARGHASLWILFHRALIPLMRVPVP